MRIRTFKASINDIREAAIIVFLCASGILPFPRLLVNASRGYSPQCPQQASGLVPGFFVFKLGIGLGDNAAADRELPPAAAAGDRADEDVGIERAVETQIEQAAAIGTAGGGL